MRHPDKYVQRQHSGVITLWSESLASSALRDPLAQICRALSSQWTFVRWRSCRVRTPSIPWHFAVCDDPTFLISVGNSTIPIAGEDQLPCPQMRALLDHETRVVMTLAQVSLKPNWSMFSARERFVRFRQHQHKVPRVRGPGNITVGVTIFLLALTAKCVPFGRRKSPCCSLVSTLPIIGNKCEFYYSNSSGCQTQTVTFPERLSPILAASSSHSQVE